MITAVQQRHETRSWVLLSVKRVTEWLASESLIAQHQADVRNIAARKETGRVAPQPDGKLNGCNITQWVTKGLCGDTTGNWNVTKSNQMEQPDDCSVTGETSDEAQIWFKGKPINHKQAARISKAGNCDGQNELHVCFRRSDGGTQVQKMSTNC